MYIIIIEKAANCFLKGIARVRCYVHQFDRRESQTRKGGKTRICLIKVKQRKESSKLFNRQATYWQETFYSFFIKKRLVALNIVYG